MIVLSPHYDDAVLSCGRLMAANPGARVVNVFTGLPPDATVLTSWDRRCGFRDAAEAMAARVEEDRAALARVGATGLGLGFLDDQYGGSPTDEALADAIDRVLGELGPDEVLVPVGMFHQDHLRVHRAARRVMAARAGEPGWTWAFYEEVPYRGHAGWLLERLAAMAAEGVCLVPRRQLGAQDDPAAREAKREAVLAYASQLRVLGDGGSPEAAEAERCWTVVPAPAVAMDLRG